MSSNFVSERQRISKLRAKSMNLGYMILRFNPHMLRLPTDNVWPEVLLHVI